MGLLSVGTPLSWDETRALADHVRKHGIEQFINLYHRLKDRHGDCLKWGDEIEYMILKFDHVAKKVRVSLRGADVLHALMASEDHSDPSKNAFLWRPEYASYMVEGTPGMPYGGMLSCFNVVEDNMARRRAEVSKFLEPGETLLTMGNFPRLGCPDFVWPTDVKTTPGKGVSHSIFFPDGAIYSAHPRFRTLTRNIRERRGEKVAIHVPLFLDVNTKIPFIEDFRPYGDEKGEFSKAAKPNHIYLDAMGFGMGCCCLQVTFQAVNVEEARWLYDQLTPMTPVLLALTASTPIFRGFLADVDCRWNVIAASVDDRTAEERGFVPLKKDRFVIPKSRYDTTSCYLYSCSAQYSDFPLLYDAKIYERLLEGGIDSMLAKHIANLFIRDPIQLYKERVDQNDQEETEHFETIQSSNWMNMRFKPPPPDNPSIGWRVEFRPSEVQLTDFENAAYVVFVVLLTRVLVSFGLSLLVPISKVNENMERAQKRDAVLTQKFYFRRGVATCATPPHAATVCGGMDGGHVHEQLRTSQNGAPPSGEAGNQERAAAVVEMTIDEIINGKQPDFPGLVPLIQQYLDSADVDVETRCTIQQYLKFIQKRARGEIVTLARWMREFVQKHPEYEQDSVVKEEICYDMLKSMSDIAEGRKHCPKLLGMFQTRKFRSESMSESAVNGCESCT